MTFQYLSAIFAQAAAPAAPAATGNPAPGGNLFQLVIWIFMILVIMWVFFVLPKKNQAKQMQKLVDNLKKNDRVMTYSGIIGTIYSVDKEQNEVVLKVDDNTKIRFSLSSVYFIYNDKDNKEKKESKEDKSSDKN